MTNQFTKKTKIILIVLAAVILVGAVVGLALGLALSRKERVILNGITVNQIGKEQRIAVSWDTSGGGISKVDIVVKKSNGLIESSVTVSNPSLIAKSSAVLDASYGKNTVEVKVYGGVNSSSKTEQVAVSADEYVIAPLVATMPVTIFSLKMEQFTNGFALPTFVWLQRGAAWNYKELPSNVYLIPMSTLDVMSGYLGDNFSSMYYETSKWVGELYEINNNSKFHFYVNDYHPFVWLECTYLNRIPQSNYDVTLLTDGTASNAVFESLYMSDDSLNVYNEMVKEYNDFKHDLWEYNNHDYYDNTKNIPHENEKTRNWILPMLKEESNVKLILTRAYFNAASDESTDETIKRYVNELSDPSVGKIETVNLYSLLNALTEQGKADVKKLYKFGDNVFEKAAVEGKTAMVILGTRTANEDDFASYVAAVKAIYGDECVYYYKGHPWTPTSSDSDKAKKLKDMGLIDVDSSIAAELLFFFNPEIAATGYASTTFGSLNDNQVGGIFGVTPEESAKYSGYVKFVINAYSVEYADIASAGDMVIEFIGNPRYDVAVCKIDGKKTSIKYYKRQNSGFAEVSGVK